MGMLMGMLMGMGWCVALRFGRTGVAMVAVRVRLVPLLGSEESILNNQWNTVGGVADSPFPKFQYLSVLRWLAQASLKTKLF